ncbi:MAG: hypothetical protein IJ087_20060, partial [Eggerthellaceae bacterium]|nr:hypothetical protein [Eggerthellaceae bacterium]
DVGGQEVVVPAEDRTLENFDVNVPEQTRQIDADMFPPDYDEAYQFTLQHLTSDWGVLLLFSVVCVGSCILILRRDERVK